MQQRFPLVDPKRDRTWLLVTILVVAFGLMTASVWNSKPSGRPEERVVFVPLFLVAGIGLVIYQLSFSSKWRATEFHTDASGIALYRGARRLWYMHWDEIARVEKREYAVRSKYRWYDAALIFYSRSGEEQKVPVRSFMFGEFTLEYGITALLMTNNVPIQFGSSNSWFS